MLELHFPPEGLRAQSSGIDTGLLSLTTTVRLGAETLTLDLPFAQIAHARAHTFYGMADARTFRAEHPRGFALTYRALQPDRWDALIVEASLENHSGEDIHLLDFTLVNRDCALSCEGDPASWQLGAMTGDFYMENLAAVRPSANDLAREMWAGFHMDVPYALPEDEKHTDGHWRMFSEYLTLYTDEGRRGLFVCPNGAPEAFWNYECYVKDGTVRLCARCDMCSVLVKDGGARRMQSLLLGFEPFGDIAPEAMREIASTHGSRAHRSAPHGWCSWYDLASKVSAASVLETVGAFEQYADRVRPDFIQLDDGFQIMPGDWRPNEKFPDGFGEITRRVRALGARPGIWLAPMIAHEKSELFLNHPDWFARNEKGELADRLDNWGKSSYALDPTHPGVRAFLREVIEQKKRDGFTYFKIDFNSFYTNGYTSFDPEKTALQAYREVYALYREAIGEDGYLLSCSGLTRGTVGFADGSRTGTDSCDNWHEFACCIQCAIWQNPVKSVVNGVFYACDPDVTYLKTDKLTEHERRMWHSFVALYGGVAQVSDPMARREAELRQYEILMPPAPEKGLAVRPACDRDNARFGYIARRDWGAFGCYLVWNPSDAPARVNTALSPLGELGERFHVYSFWDERYLGVLGSDFETEALPPHGGLLLRFTPVGDARRPALVGDTLHASMGAADIAKLRASEQVIEVELNPAGAREGELVFVCDAPYAVEFAEHCNASAAYANGLLRVRLEARARDQKQRVLLRR